MSNNVNASIQGKVAKMLDLVVIEPSSSPWASPVVLVSNVNPKEGTSDSVSTSED